MKDGYITKGEAIKMAGVAFGTFDKYCRKLGIEGIHEGRCTYYERKQIEMFMQLLDEEVQGYIRLIEKKTGKEVRLV